MVNIFRVKQTYQNLLRVKEILQVLTKHGFGHFVSQLNLPSYFPGLRQFRVFKSKVSIREETGPARLRLALQELGPTFVKLGQILSGRPDILPEEYVEEFKELQDNVSPFSLPEVFGIIERELGAPAKEIFPRFDEAVLASGSIGQVHRASLPDGSEVIIKVKRPGIEEVVATDIEILAFLAEIAEHYIEELRVLQPKLVVDEFARTMRKELDFTLEASYCEKFYDLLREDPHVSSPKVYWQYTTNDVITLERLRGVSIGEIEVLRKRNIDLKLLAKRLSSSFMQQYFVWGLFHGDPHPGNILVGNRGELMLIDFGSVGHLSNELRDQLSTIVLALVRHDIDMIIETYADIGIFERRLNKRDLKTDILEMMDKYFNVPFQHLDMTKVLQDIVLIAQKHNVIMPRDFLLLIKSLVTITTQAKELDPDFNVARAAAPHMSAILREKFSPKKLANIAIFQLWSLFSLFQKLPSETKELLRRFKAGDIQIIVQHQGLEKHVRDIGKIINRLAVSIIIAAIIIGSSLLATVQPAPQQEMPSIGVISYAIAVALGLLLAISMLRSR